MQISTWTHNLVQAARESSIIFETKDITNINKQKWSRQIHHKRAIEAQLLKMVCIFRNTHNRWMLQIKDLWLEDYQTQLKIQFHKLWLTSSVTEEMLHQVKTFSIKAKIQMVVWFNPEELHTKVFNSSYHLVIMEECNLLISQTISQLIWQTQLSHNQEVTLNKLHRFI